MNRTAKSRPQDVSAMHGRSIRLRVIALVGAVLCVAVIAVFSAPRADGAVTYALGGEIGPLPQPPDDIGEILVKDVSIDQATGEVYVTRYYSALSGEDGAVYVLDLDGATIESYSEVGRGWYTSGFVTSTGDLYTLENNWPSHDLHVFDAPPAGLLPSFEFVLPDKTFTSQSAQTISADSAGNAYVPNWGDDTIDVYDTASTAPIRLLDQIGGSGANELRNPRGVALDSDDNVFVADTGNKRVLKFDSDGDFVRIVHSGDSQSLAIDPANGELFVLGKDSGQFHVTVYNAAGVKIADFGHGSIPSGFIPNPGIAVDSSDGTVYVSDDTIAGVRFFERTETFPPMATTLAATGIGQTAATLHGEVGPNNLTSSCKFHYTLEAAYQQGGFAGAKSIPCDTDPLNGDDPIAVSATPIDLQPNSAYRFRVSATSTEGTSDGNPLQFSTAAKVPSATTQPATGIGTDSATLRASVNAHNASTDCELQWGSSAAYGNVAPCSVDPVAGGVAVNVSAAISGLSPNTTYHYRVRATNIAGEGTGAEMTFSTATLPTPSVVDPPPPLPDVAGLAQCQRKARQAFSRTSRRATKIVSSAKGKAKGAARRRATKIRKEATKIRNRQLADCKRTFG